jgi:hypothetical protein
MQFYAFLAGVELAPHVAPPLRLSRAAVRRHGPLKKKGKENGPRVDILMRVRACERRLVARQRPRPARCLLTDEK